MDDRPNSSPGLAAERTKVLRLMRALLQAIRSLKRRLSEATAGEVGADGPIAAMALGEPTMEPRDPDPVKTMAETGVAG